MKHQRKSVYLFSLLLIGTLLFNACSKESDDNPEPSPEEATGSVSATITFMDTEETVQFTGTAMGAIATGSSDTVVMTFTGKNTPMQFFLMINPANKGEHTMGQNDFKCIGFFSADTLNTSLKETYLIGAENFDENGTIKDAAVFNISAVNKTSIKGTFSATMVSNSTIYENGELQSGAIKTIKVTNGKFNLPLFSVTDFEDIE